jgi:hypothetical protein
MAVLPFGQKAYSADFVLLSSSLARKAMDIEGDFSRRDCVHVIARNGMSYQPM